MLSLLFLSKGKKNTLEQKVMAIQNGNKELQNTIIQEYKPFIAKTVSSVCRRYINETDDEFSIGLIAFNEAIEKYSPEKGSSLISFAEVIIRRRVIDFIRTQSRHDNIPLQTNNEENEHQFRPKISVEENISINEHEKLEESRERKDEILHFQRLLASFNLSVHELVDISPKHADARINAIKVAEQLANRKDLMKEVFEKERLPIKEIEDIVQVSRKTIERNRKYIIAVAIILSGDFPYLKDYIKGGVGSVKKGVIMGEHKGYVTLLTPEGEFVKTRKPNFPYEIGDEILVHPSSKRFSMFSQQVWKGLAVACAVFVLAFAAIFAFPSNETAHAYVTIDTNPSLELGINEELEVIEVNAFNDGAKRILEQIPNYLNQNIFDVTEAIFNKSKEFGYIKEQEIVISTFFDENEFEQDKVNELKEGIETLSDDIQKESNVVVEIFEATKTDRVNAKDKGLSTGKWIHRQKQIKNNKNEVPSKENGNVKNNNKPKEDNQNRPSNNEKGNKSNPGKGNQGQKNKSSKENNGNKDNGKKNEDPKTNEEKNNEKNKDKRNNDNKGNKNHNQDTNNKNQKGKKSDEP